jgi:hypothetical protein
VLTHNGVIDRASAYNELILWLKELFSKNKIG